MDTTEINCEMCGNEHTVLKTRVGIAKFCNNCKKIRKKGFNARRYRRNTIQTITEDILPTKSIVYLLDLGMLSTIQTKELINAGFATEHIACLPYITPDYCFPSKGPIQ